VPLVDPKAVNEPGHPRYGVADQSQHKERRSHHGSSTDYARPRGRLSHGIQRERHLPAQAAGHQAPGQPRATRRRRPFRGRTQHVGADARGPIAAGARAGADFKHQPAGRSVRTDHRRPGARPSLCPHAAGQRPGRGGEDGTGHRAADDPHRARHAAGPTPQPHRAGRGSAPARVHDIAPPDTQHPAPPRPGAARPRRPARSRQRAAASTAGRGRPGLRQRLGEPL